MRFRGPRGPSDDAITPAARDANARSLDGNGSRNWGRVSDGLALSAMLGRGIVVRREQSARARPPHFRPRVKRVIMLFMFGGPSHLDTFDPKPLLARDSGRPLPPAHAPASRLVPQSDGQPRGIAVRVPAARRQRALDQLAVPEPGAAGRRPLRDQLDALLQLAARGRRPGVAYRQRHVRTAQHGVVDHLRTREREPELPGIRDDLPGPLAGRCEQLRLGVPAGRLPGDPARAWRAASRRRPASPSSATARPGATSSVSSST